MTNAATVTLLPGVEIPQDAIHYAFASSGGPGGQNVNRRRTKALLRIDVADIPISQAARQRLLQLAGPSRVIGDDNAETTSLQLVSEEHRTQAQNRDACWERLRQLVAQAKVVPKVRRKPRKPAKLERVRLEEKKKNAQRKQARSWKPGRDG